VQVQTDFCKGKKKQFKGHAQINFTLTINKITSMFMSYKKCGVKRGNIMENMVVIG
jgi:hypothetical protein